MSCLKLIRTTPTDILRIIDDYHYEVLRVRKWKKVMAELKRETKELKKEVKYEYIQDSEYALNILIIRHSRTEIDFINKITEITQYFNIRHYLNY